MSYRELLTELINDSGKTLNTIVKELKKEGVEITPNYLSILKNSDSKIASEEVSRAIAKVCNAKYEDILVVQGYLDKAPDTIRNMLELVADLGCKTASQLAEKNPENKLVYMEKIEKYKNEYCMAYRLCETMAEMSVFSVDKLLSDIEYITKETMKDKLDKIKSGEWLLVPINPEEEVIKISNKEAQIIKESLVSDNS